MSQRKRQRCMGIVTLTGLLLSGCMSKPVIWSNQLVSHEQAQVDLFDCEAKTRAAWVSFGGGIAGEMRAQQFLARCMVSKGYHRQ